MTVKQLTGRVQNLKRHIHLNKDKIGTDLRNYTKKEKQSGKMKFTEAGFPIHDYIKEMRDEREKREYKKSLQVRVDPSETNKFAHLKKKTGPPQDIVKHLQEEMLLERKEQEQRFKECGYDGLMEEEKVLYNMQKEMKAEAERTKKIIHELCLGDMNGIDSR